MNLQTLWPFMLIVLTSLWALGYIILKIIRKVEHHYIWKKRQKLIKTRIIR